MWYERNVKYSVFCLYVIKSHYGLSVLAVSLMGYQNKFG